MKAYLQMPFAEKIVMIHMMISYVIKGSFNKVSVSMSVCQNSIRIHHALSVKAFHKVERWWPSQTGVSLLQLQCDVCSLKRDCVCEFQARNFMRDMKVGQQAFFYHSNCKEPGIAGIIKVSMTTQKIQCNSKDMRLDVSFKDNISVIDVPDCKGSVCWPYTVRQERRALWSIQQTREP